MKTYSGLVYFHPVEVKVLANTQREARKKIIRRAKRKAKTSDVYID